MKMLKTHLVKISMFCMLVGCTNIATATEPASSSGESKVGTVQPESEVSDQVRKAREYGRWPWSRFA